MSDEIQEPHWADPAMQEGPPPDEPVPDFPPFVKLGGTAMAHMGDGEYYRPAGHWGVWAAWNATLGCFNVVGRELDPRIKHLIGRPLFECSEEEYKEDNRGYA